MTPKTIAIIGAGPVGSYTAFLLSKQGFQVHLYDSKKTSQIGSPIQCTGLLTSEIKKFIPLKKEFLINTLSQLQVFSPNQNRITINKTEYLVNRKKFDQFILNLAIKKGTKFHPEHKLVEIQEKDAQTTLIFQHNSKKKTLSPDIIIGADGPNSLLYKYLNPFKKKQLFVGLQATIKGKFNPHTYQTFFGQHISPDFFAWLVPESKTKARIGVVSSENPLPYFNNHLKHLNIKPKDILEKQGGLIPLFDPKSKTKSKNIFVIGDAASHVKATTLGGILPGFKAAVNLTNHLTNQPPAFKNHQNLKRHLLIRKTLDKFSDRDYNKLINLTSQPQLQKILETHSRENPKKLLQKLLLKEPRLLSFSKYLF
ncbi:NAD(P)/FAD-dependent oxidoreductase [Candidatus Woesearchaeota archaeon]|nr:NAD(P)/FAD-dependent oxidoreductase [Candidatus Woesearchaeota archaeon]